MCQSSPLRNKKDKHLQAAGELFYDQSTAVHSVNTAVWLYDTTAELPVFQYVRVSSKTAACGTAAACTSSR